VRLRVRVGVRLFAVVAKRTLSRAVHNRRELRRRDADLALFRGFLGGFFTAVRFALDGRVFIDEDPPAPITLGVATHGGEQ
jgi:fluoride ion exporter CrcB/FEX